MHDGIENITRRRLTAGLLAGVLAFALPASAAWAEDGGKGGGGGGGGGDGGGDGGGGSGGGDNGGGDGGGNGSGDNSGGGTPSSNSSDHVLNAVQSGAAAPLKDILAVVKKTYDGDVVRVKLTGQGQKLVYDIRILGTDNQLRDIFVDAKSRKIISAGIY